MPDEIRTGSTFASFRMPRRVPILISLCSGTIVPTFPSGVCLMRRTWLPDCPFTAKPYFFECEFITLSPETGLRPDTLSYLEDCYDGSSPFFRRKCIKVQLCGFPEVCYRFLHRLPLAEGTHFRTFCDVHILFRVEYRCECFHITTNIISSSFIVVILIEPLSKGFPIES